MKGKKEPYKISVSGEKISEFIGVRSNTSDTSWIIDHLPTGLKVSQCEEYEVAVMVAVAISEWVGRHALKSDDGLRTVAAFSAPLRSYIAAMSYATAPLSFGDWCARNKIDHGDL